MLVLGWNTPGFAQKQQKTAPVKAIIDLVTIHDDRVKVVMIPQKTNKDEIIFQIPKTVPGTYNILCSFISYNTITITGVKIEAGKSTQLDFNMEETERAPINERLLQGDVLQLVDEKSEFDFNLAMIINADC